MSMSETFVSFVCFVVNENKEIVPGCSQGHLEFYNFQH